MKQYLTRFFPIAVFIVAFILLQNWWRIDLAINPIDPQLVHDQDIILYSTSWCRYCTKTRNFLRSANLPFTEFDIEKSARGYQQYQKISGRGVPVLKINHQIIQGYQPQAIRSAVNSLNKTHQH